ncbi:MAG: hypothetical protein GXP42_14675 [Chloroflexi bacterium]|nr:hypothetical protein [Chloroflexota bacterium]
MNLATGRDLALIFLAIESIVIVLVLGVALYFSYKYTREAARWLRRIGLPQAQRYTSLASKMSREYSQKVTDPIIQTETKISQVTGAISAFSKALQRRQRS